jgi:hypothetical protein
VNKKGPDRHPGRVLNPISYEKPASLFSNCVPVSETLVQPAFHHSELSVLLPRWEQNDQT